MRNTATLSSKLVRIGMGLLLVALTSIGLTLWVTWKLSGGAAALNEAGRMRMQTWRLTSEVQAEVHESKIADLIQEFDRSMTVLKTVMPRGRCLCPGTTRSGNATPRLSSCGKARKPVIWRNR